MSRVCRRVAGAIAVAGVALAAPGGDAAAGPVGRLVTDGECPSRGQMEAALAGVVDVDEGRGEWTIAIAPVDRGAGLTLRDRRGGVALVRRIASRDCGAMARAFAVILHAYFRQLAAVRGRAPADRAAARRRSSSAVAAGPPSRMPAPRAPEPPAVEPAGPPPALEPRGRTVEPRGPTVEPAGPTSIPESGSGATLRSTQAPRPVIGATRRAADPPAVVARSAPAGEAPDAAGMELALAAGGTMSDSGASAFGLLEAGWRFGRRASLRIQASSATPTVQDTAGMRVELQHSALAAGLGYHLGGRVWLRPALLAGAAAWRVDPLDIEDASRLRVQPIATAIAAAGVRLGRAVSLRAEVGLTTFLRTDRFLVLPAGEVARSPRTALAVSVGIEWASFH